VDVCVLVQVRIILFAAYNHNQRHFVHPFSLPGLQCLDGGDRGEDPGSSGIGLFAFEDGMRRLSNRVKMGAVCDIDARRKICAELRRPMNPSENPGEAMGKISIKNEYIPRRMKLVEQFRYDLKGNHFRSYKMN
jgi:hypothetical protein